MTLTTATPEAVGASPGNNPMCAAHAAVTARGACGRCGTFICEECTRGTRNICPHCQRREVEGLPSLSRRGKAASVLLVFPMGTDVVLALYGLILYRFLPGIAGTGDLVYVEAAGRLATALVWLALPTRLAAPIAYLMWFHLAVKTANSKGHGVGVTPNWSVRWWFIPVANLIKPILIVRDLLTKLGGGDAVSTSGAMLWWSTLMLYIVALNASGGLSDLGGYAFWGGRVAISILGFTSAFFATRVIGTLNRLIHASSKV